MRFLKREDDLERELRARRPEPRRELVNEIARMISTERRHGASRGARLGVAVSLTAGMLAALGAFGGLSYAANGVSHAVASAVHVVAPVAKVVPSTSESSAQAQYKVAMCLHGHTIDVDSHAQNGMAQAGATPGACKGGAFKPNEKLVVACFKGTNVDVAKTSADTKAEIAKLKKLGITLGFCKA